MYRKVIVIAVLILLVLSVGFNLYSLSWKPMTLKYQQIGAGNVLAAIKAEIQQKGEVTIYDNDKPLVLVLKTSD